MHLRRRLAALVAGHHFYFSIPYLFGVTAALDRSERSAAAAGSAYLLGFAAGPLVAGAVIAGSRLRWRRCGLRRNHRRVGGSP